MPKGAERSFQQGLEHRPAGSFHGGPWETRPGGTSSWHGWKISWVILHYSWPRVEFFFGFFFDPVWYFVLSGSEWQRPVSKKGWVRLCGQTKVSDQQLCKRSVRLSARSREAQGFYERRCWVMNDNEETKGDWRWNRVYTERITRKKACVSYYPLHSLGLHRKLCALVFENSLLGKLCVLCSWFILHALLWTRAVLIR